MTYKMRLDNWYRQNITIKRPSSSVDSGGSPVSVFATLGNVKCVVQPLSGLEPILGGRKYTQPSYIIYCNNNEDITMTDIITYDGSDYQVAEKIIYPNTYLKLIIEKTN